MAPSGVQAITVPKAAAAQRRAGVVHVGDLGTVEFMNYGSGLGFARH